MKQTNIDFVQLCIDTMAKWAFEFGLQQVRIARGDYGEEVRYANETTGVKFEFEARDFAIYVSLHRLRNGIFPDYDSDWDSDRDARNRLDVLCLVKEDVLKDSLEQPYEPSDFNVGRILRVLKGFDNALRKYAEPILTGDFTELDRINRAKFEQLS